MLKAKTIGMSKMLIEFLKKWWVWTLPGICSIKLLKKLNLVWVRSRIERLKCICPKKKTTTPTIIASRPVRLRNVTEIITWFRDVMKTICRTNDWTYKRYNIYTMHQRRTSSDHQRFTSKSIYLVFFWILWKVQSNTHFVNIGGNALRPFTVHRIQLTNEGKSVLIKWITRYACNRSINRKSVSLTSESSIRCDPCSPSSYHNVTRAYQTTEELALYYVK